MRGAESEEPPSLGLLGLVNEVVPGGAAVEQILVGVGPGSFSGIRASIALALGLAEGWGAEVVPILSTHAVAVDWGHVRFLGIFSDARRGRYFFTAYEEGELTRPPALIAPEELDLHLSKCSLAVTTDGLAGVPERVTPQATGLIEWFQSRGADSGLALEPVYLHPPMTT